MAGSDVPVNDMADEVANMVNNLTKNEAQQIEDRYWKRTLGTTDLAARGYRSFWD